MSTAAMPEFEFLLHQILHLHRLAPAFDRVTIFVEAPTSKRFVTSLAQAGSR